MKRMPANKPRNSAPKTAHLEIFQWKPGQSGNPSGRPRKKPLTERYEQVLEEALPEKARLKLGLAPGATYGDAIAAGQARKAVMGATEAAKEIREAVEGKSPQAVFNLGDNAEVKVILERVGA